MHMSDFCPSPGTDWLIALAVRHPTAPKCLPGAARRQLRAGGTCLLCPCRQSQCSPRPLLSSLLAISSAVRA